MHIALIKALPALLLTSAAAGPACASGVQSSLHYNNLALTVQAVAAAAPRYAVPLLAMPSTVPEPPAYLMLLIGVGLVGLAARRQAPPPRFDD